MIPRFLVTESIPAAGLDLLYDAGEVTLLPAVPSAAKLKTLCANGDYDVLFSRLGDRVDAQLLASAKLRGVANYAVGFNKLCSKALSRPTTAKSN